MRDFAPHYTGRYRVRYIALGQVHVNTFRTGRTAPDMAVLSDQVADFYNALTAARVPSWTILGADFAAADSEIFLPATAPVVDPGTADALPATFKPVNISFVGRSLGGSRVALFLYGVAYNPLTASSDVLDYRELTTESTAINNAVAALQAITSLTAIDDQEVLWKPYANIGLNAYYQRKQRG